MGEMGYRLIDGDWLESHSWEISAKRPELIDRQQYCAGDQVKLAIEDPRSHQSEYVWVRVTRNDTGSYQGELLTGPKAFRAEVLQPGDTIAFETKHILEHRRS